MMQVFCFQVYAYQRYSVALTQAYLNLPSIKRVMNRISTLHNEQVK